MIHYRISKGLYLPGLKSRLFLLTISIIFFFSIPVYTPSQEVETHGLTPLENRISSGEFGNIHSVIVMEDDTKVEWYFSGADQRAGIPRGTVNFNQAELHDVRSATKSIVSLLFGIALSDGAIDSIEDPVSNYFPDYAKLITPGKERIRLRHLLSMTSGLGWDERTYPYGDERNSETALDRAPDRIRYILSLPIAAPPGERFLYSSGDIELIARIVARSTKTPLNIYVREKIFRKLGIEDFEWAEYEGGGPIASWGLRLRPRDSMEPMIKLWTRSLIPFTHDCSNHTNHIVYFSSNNIPVNP